MKMIFNVLLCAYKLFVYIVGTIVLLVGFAGFALVTYVTISDFISRMKVGKRHNDCK